MPTDRESSAAARRRRRAIAAAIAIVVALLGVVVFYVVTRDRGASSGTAAPPATASRGGAIPHAGSAQGAAPAATVPAAIEPAPGHGRAIVVPIAAPGGGVTGRVINWSTGDGVPGAELVFDGPDGAATVRSADGGRFELAPPAPGRFRLATASAPGFLPYAPEWEHSPITVDTTAGQRVDGVVVFLRPALDYTGTVVDAAGAPVAGAKVTLLGSPDGEQAIERLVTEWTTARDGTFGFHAPDFAVFEAVHGAARGRAVLGGDTMVTRKLVIQLGDLPAADQVIAGRVVDDHGAPVADALVRAIAQTTRPVPGEPEPAHAPVFAVSGPDGRFTLAGVEPIAYEVSAEADDHAPARREGVTGGTRDLVLELAAGTTIAGVVETTAGDPVPAFTLLVARRIGVGRDVLIERSVVHPAGRFEVVVEPGDYELVAAPGGWAASAWTRAAAGARDVRVVVSAGAVLRGRVVSSGDGAPISYARVMYEMLSGGGSAQPANAGTVTRDDGSFELRGIRPGPVSLTVGAGGHHPKIEAGIVARDGDELGPITITLTPLAPGETPRLELVGIGVALSGDGDALRVDRVIPGGGAEAAGIVAGDRVTQIDGTPTVDLGVDGAVARIRGVAGTTVRVTLLRAGAPVDLIVERRPLKA
jgi:hypothetical protein